MHIQDTDSIICEIPETAIERMRGLLGRDGLEKGRVMLFRNCRLIHTFGMRFALDVVFTNAYGEVVKTIRNLPPNRIAFGGLRARHTIEAQAGWQPAGIVPGVYVLSHLMKPDPGFDPTKL